MGETAGNNDDDDDELLTSSSNGDVNQILQNLTIQIMSLSVSPPPVTTCTPSPTRSSTTSSLSSSSQPSPCQSSSQRRPPHCSTCGHLQQGHQRLTSRGALDELLHLVTRPNHAKLAAVLILPPDKSMLLLIGSNDEACLLEGHTHLDTGAIIAASGPGKLKEIASYIDFMARRDWTSNPTPFDVTFVTLL
ncbi:hypothetical protein OS493_004345 [Desmophyllum pertusum]|uniref:Uncharacterized protein n=1 Tax=Desmophyllum pertusum TaxID=174260 RepID=A0A9W9ZWM9_9CNID|nr:hypothetical protein OS493_004345 [Desmophyllum pertusum]